MSTIFSFKSKENQHDVYRAKDCMKKFYELLMRYSVLKRKKNEVIYKRTAGIIWKHKNVLYLPQKIRKETW